MKTQRLIHKRWMLFLLMSVLPATVFAEDWGQIIKLVASDRHANAHFGFSVSISGDYAIVGASLEATDDSGTNPLFAAGAAYIFVRSGNIWVQQQKLAASDRDGSELFGYSVCVDGDYAIVGAVYDHHDSSHGDSLFRAGSAYIFKRSGSVWTQQQKLVASDREEEDDFGISVSISGDYAIVGACFQDLSSSSSNPILDAGAAYIFVRTDTGWIQQQKITPSTRGIGYEFGYSVSLSGDYAIIGAAGEDQNPDYMDSLDAGAAYVFRRIDTTWTQTQKLVASDRMPSDNFGAAVSISGNYAIIGSPDHDFDTSSVVTPQAGAAYIYMRTDSSWFEQQKIFDTTRYRDLHFGYSVSLSGDNVIAGTEGANMAFMFARSSDSWILQKELRAADHVNSADFGWSVSVSGEYSIVGSYSDWRDTSGGNSLSGAGAAYMFGHTSVTDVEQSDDGRIPRVFRLDQNYPNPFNPVTTIQFDIPKASFVTMKVYNVLGQEVETLVNEHKEAGRYEVEFDGSKLTSGVYFYRLTAGTLVSTKKSLVVK